LAAIVEQAGHEAKIIDAELEGKGIDDIVEEAVPFTPDLVGITATTSIAHIAVRVADALKTALPSVPCLIGGPHVAALPEESLTATTSFDYAIVGEAENAILPFVDFVAGKLGVTDVPGLVYRDEHGDVRRNDPAPLEKQLDRLPFPDRTKLDLNRYLWSVPGRGIVHITTIMTSRGCPFRCIFCSAATVFGRKVRKRDVGDVLDELEYCVNELGITHFSFIDDTLTLNHRRVRELCAGIAARGLDITWEGWTRANTVDAEILATMYEAGFRRISFGIESANTEIAKRVKKGVPLDAYPKAYAAAKSVGLETRGSVILGMPGETRRTVMETLWFACGLRDCDQLYINIATPYPATELYDLAVAGEHGMRLLTRDFSEYRRYGNAVIAVNDLSAADLNRYQRLGFLMFYLRPRRIYYNYKRAGLAAFVENATAFLKSVVLRWA
jgi:radical SAM superfamily enzyme YgiQ (UPF0313 family)